MAKIGFERRTERRAEVSASATLIRGGADAGKFLVANLSASGALLIGASELERGDTALFRAELPGTRPVVVPARVLRGGIGDGVEALAVEFRHRSPDTEDAIQDAVLFALEEDAPRRRALH